MSKSLAKITKSVKGKYFGKDSLIHNNIVLYVVFALALINFTAYVMVGDIQHVIVFALTGFIVSFMSKNMVVILSLAMAITNIVKMTMGGRRGRLEGLEDNTETEPEKEKKTESAKSETEPTKEKIVDDLDEVAATEDNQKRLKEIKKDGKELIKLQDKIIDGFNEIEPYMKKAEGLTDKIQKTAETIQQKK